MASYLQSLAPEQPAPTAELCAGARALTTRARSRDTAVVTTDDSHADLDVLTVIVRPRWREPKVRRALIGLVFVVGVFVVAPVVAMLAAAN